jgi:hypothetical protein
VGRGVDHSSPSSAEVKNEWSFTSIPPLSAWHVMVRTLPKSSAPTASEFVTCPVCDLFCYVNALLSVSRHRKSTSVTEGLY